MKILKSSLSAIGRIRQVAVVAILIILAAGAGYFASSLRTVTSTVTSTVTTTAPPITTTTTMNMTYASSQTMTTQTPSSPFPSYSMAETNVSTVNSTLGLSLQLYAEPCGSLACIGSLDIMASVANVRNVSNNVTDQNNWQYPSDSLNPYNPCGSPGEVGFGIFRGYYDSSNYSNAVALTLYNDSTPYVCTTMIFPNTTYSFLPNSDNVQLVNSSGTSVYNESISVSKLIGGYWTGQIGSATYQTFPNGTYTIISADEWGQVVFLYFTAVIPACATYPFGCDETTTQVTSGQTP